jgi:hypothetical protein
MTMQVGMPPHIIIIGMPVSIIDIMRLHISAHISSVMPCPGIISIIMPFAMGFIVQVIIIMGIMPIVGIMPMPGIIPIPDIMFGLIIGIIPIIGICIAALLIMAPRKIVRSAWVWPGRSLIAAALP